MFQKLWHKVSKNNVDGLSLDKILLIAEALEKYPNQVLQPTSGKKKLRECFTEMDGKLLFWYNTNDNSTHICAKKFN